MLRNCFLDFAVEHWFGCRATEPRFAGDIGAIEIWLIDWLIYLHSMLATSLPTYSLKWNEGVTHSVPWVKTNTSARTFHSCTSSLWNKSPAFCPFNHLNCKLQGTSQSTCVCFGLFPTDTSTPNGLWMLRNCFIDFVVDVQDWFNTYLDYLLYVSWCTNVWFMFMRFSSQLAIWRFCLATGYTYGTVCVEVSHCHTKVENSRLWLERHH